MEPIESDSLLPKNIGETLNSDRYQKRIIAAANPPTPPPVSPREPFNPDTAYTLIYFGLGRYFGLNLSENALLALIYSLSKKGLGYCYASQAFLADTLSLTPQTINEYIGKFVLMDLIEKALNRHPRWHTIQWRLAPKALDRLRHIREQLNKAKQNRR